ncbi:MAG: peptide chain release factor 1 [Elusimicrobia bacterium CG1_02_37_114]|nr:MAG: peptide chain release factor 1 [Elusimicrobia bacterium CG1_02_37_114]PIV53250.1 MAG: peptide chain release factor 1 [Elusimicrobia bacterium CG02_land_8_20_14_3_00_37_13]PIZ14040.1 MAG: peptide chain release factor 1 [Elusimicrobia bacterium CG_4_10_14_0_8_um_filter_37_32]
MNLNESDRIELDKLEKSFVELEKKITDQNVISKDRNYTAYLKEHGNIMAVVEKYREYKKKIQQIKETRDFLNKNDIDPELKLIAQDEEKELEVDIGKIVNELSPLRGARPGRGDNGKQIDNVIVEIRAGTGGEEAALFASDLLRMYTRYCENKGWKCDMIDSRTTGLKGFKEVIFSVEGKGVYDKLKYESGIHRVQRVPLTEASGRIHTSAATVAVLPQVEDVELEIRNEDLRIDTYRASGHGGQHLQKTDSAVRITHLPTGIVAQCQDERSQGRNKEKAMKLLRARVYQIKKEKQERDISDKRKKQIGSGDRSEKIRTYNFSQNRVTDHRINYSLYNLHDVLDGNLDKLIEKLESPSIPL